MSVVSFAVVGGGFRTLAFLRVARELPHHFRVCGLVVRNPERGRQFEREWGLPTYRSLEQLLQSESPDFVVLSVPSSACEEYLVQLALLGIPALAETPPSKEMEGLQSLHRLTEQGAKIQVAEQYQFHPMHMARQAVIDSGVLGSITQATVSVSHGYHGVSLLRKFVGVGFQPASIRAMRFESEMLAGPTRSGPPTEESLITSRRDIAWIQFGDKLAIYDFTRDQHRSWIRSSHVSIRGARGEIQDHQVNVLQDYSTPKHMTFQRINRGEEENVEGYFMSGIMLGDSWVYRNPFPLARLYDDEIAVATCLQKMAAYIAGGPSFYDLREASQDHYLAMLIEHAVETGERVTSTVQPWAEAVQG